MDRLTALASAWSSFRDMVTSACLHYLLAILRHGPVPQHVGFIMDGNRRYAKKHGVQTGVGHTRGSDKLQEILEWCLHLGVRVISVYAFSIENFKRSVEEVDTLMRLAMEKLRVLAENSTLIREYDVQIRVIGDLSLLRPDVREAIDHVMSLSEGNSGPILNICFPYTARHEMTQAVERVVHGVRKGVIGEEGVDEEMLDRCMFTGEDAPLDVLIRTSGEIRLSDYLLWQSSIPGCQIHFTSVLWPEMGLQHLLPPLMEYQRSYTRLQREREAYWDGVREREPRIKHMVKMGRL